MWNSPEKKVPSHQIKLEALRTLSYAVYYCMEFEPRTKEVYEALDTLRTYAQKTWCFTVFQEGLERGDPETLKKALKIIVREMVVDYSLEEF
jgi:hypothetical protein